MTQDNVRKDGGKVVKKSVALLESLWPHKKLKDWGDEDHANCNKIIQALQTAREEAYEECAKIAESFRSEYKDWGGETQTETADSIAGAIRNLINKEGKKS